MTRVAIVDSWKYRKYKRGITTLLVVTFRRTQGAQWHEQNKLLVDPLVVRHRGRILRQKLRGRIQHHGVR